MTASGDQLVLAADGVRVVVELGAGGRISLLQIGDSEIIWNGVDGFSNGADNNDPMAWGMYPMVPFAGRILDGKFTFDGVDYEVPKNHDGNAIHGYGFLTNWQLGGEASISYEFSDPWPFAGRAEQSFDLRADSLRVVMNLWADDRQPFMIGWHPWFTRQNTSGTLELDFQAGNMFQRDSLGMPGELVEDIPEGPWDDCFMNVAVSPTLRWGDLEVTLESSLGYWVVFDEPGHALCVEPQSGPPNEFNTEPKVLEAGYSTSAEFTLRWNS